MARNYRDFESDVYYEAWRSGIDPERAVQCAQDCYWDHRTAEDCVDGTAREIRHEREVREQRRMDEEHQIEMEIQHRREQEAYYAEMERQQYEAQMQEEPGPPDHTA